jgi:hypothetical protein
MPDMIFLKRMAMVLAGLTFAQALFANIAPVIPQRGLRIWVLNADSFPAYRFYIRYIRSAKDTFYTPVQQGEPYFLEGRSRITRPLAFFAVGKKDGQLAGIHEIYELKHDQNLKIRRIANGALVVTLTRRDDTSTMMMQNSISGSNPRQWLVWGSVSALLLLTAFRLRKPLRITSPSTST